jgi:hypothetical protein
MYFYNFSNRVIARRALIRALVVIRLIRLDASNLGAAPRAIWSFHFRFWRIGFELTHALSGLPATDPMGRAPLLARPSAHARRQCPQRT